MYVHERIFAQVGQRVDGMYGICLYLALEDVLDIHDIEVLSVHQLLEGIYAQGILHYLARISLFIYPGR